MRRSASVGVLVVGLALLLGWYVVYTLGVIAELRREAARSGRMYAQVYRALASPTPEASSAALFDLARHVRESGVPMVLTDPAGRPQAAANTPYDRLLVEPHARDSLATDREIRQYIAELDRENPPVTEPDVGTVHFGNTLLVRGLKVIPALQVAALAMLLIASVYTLWTRERAKRESVWAGMARESAHQLGTPLSSLNGWLELLSDHETDALTSSAVSHMRGDLERLDRVARRFERIGRPPKMEQVDACALAERVAEYFRARVPTLANRVELTSKCALEPLTVEGDPVLLEWAVEALTKNAIDALAGRGGRVDVAVDRTPRGAVRIRVSDDGPGIQRELRTRIFEPGFSTKKQGWGVGLALARRIVEENHRGKLTLVPSDRGATFDIILT